MNNPRLRRRAPQKDHSRTWLVLPALVVVVVASLLVYWQRHTVRPGEHKTKTHQTTVPLSPAPSDNQNDARETARQLLADYRSLSLRVDSADPESHKLFLRQQRDLLTGILPRLVEPERSMVMRTLMALQTGLGVPEQAIALNRELLTVVRDETDQARLKLNLAELLEQAATCSPTDAASNRREAIIGYQLALDSEELPPHERFAAGLRAAGLLQQDGDHSAAHQAAIAVADRIEALPAEPRQRLLELDPGAPGRPGALSLENTLATALLAAAKSGATATVTGVLDRMAAIPARAVPWPIWLVRVRAALGNVHDSWFMSYVETQVSRWSKDPTWPVVEYELADALQRSKRHVEAASILSDLVRRNALASVEPPDLRKHYQREALFLLGMAIYDLGERESALTVFRQFLATYPDDGRRNFVSALEDN